jgi:hypothetical protein
LSSALALLRECTQASTVVGESVTEQIAEQVSPAIPWLPSVATIETPVVNRAIASRNSPLATPDDRASRGGASFRSKPYELLLVSLAGIIAHLDRHSLASTAVQRQLRLNVALSASFGTIVLAAPSCYDL